MAGRFLRDNAFLVASVSLPVVVIGLLLLLTAIPKWTVPPPQYDLLLYTTDWRGQSGVLVDLAVRDGTLKATVRPALSDPALPGTPPRGPDIRLWRFDHTTSSASEIQLDLPTHLPEGEPPRTIVIDALQGERIIRDTKAPDGYELRTGTSGSSPGLIGALFGMHRYDPSVTIMNRGRVVSIDIPTERRHQLEFLGWIVDGHGR